MATSNEVNIQNPADENAVMEQEAVSFDEMTVLGRDESAEGIGQADSITGGQARVEGAGNENIQSDIRKEEARDQVRVEEGGIRDEGLSVKRQDVAAGSAVPIMNDNSVGQQIPVPPVDQPLPQAEVETISIANANNVSFDTRAPGV